MASSSTPTINLPIFADDDRPTWRGDINGAFNAIDSAISADRGSINDIAIGFDQTTATNIGNAASKTRVAGDNVWTKHDQLMVNVLDHGVIGDNVTDDTAALNAVLAANAGRKVLIPFRPNGYKITAPLLIAQNGVTVEMEPLTALNFTNEAADGFTVQGADVSIRGGQLNMPAVFHPQNVAWTYAVIDIQEVALRATVENVTINNVPKCGIGCRTNDAKIVGNRIYANLPSAMFTGVETAHYCIQMDPPIGADGGQGLIANNLMQKSVQGMSIANYAAGIGYGYRVIGNAFYQCYNHGIYAQDGVGNVIEGNTFFECQVSIVISGRGHSVIGNTLFTDTTGNSTDMTGINGRDLIDSIIGWNTIIGDVTATNVPISIDNINGAQLSGVEVVGNVVTVNGTGDTGHPCIRIGTQGKTQTMNRCKVNQNVVKGPGQSSVGLIAAYTSGTTYYGYGNEFSDNNVTITGVGHGVTINNQKGARVNNNTVRNEYNAAAAATQIHVQLLNCVASTARNIISINAPGSGANLTIQCVRAEATSSNCVLGPLTVMHEAGVAATTPYVDVSTGSVKIQKMGNYAAATTLGAVSGKVAVFDESGNTLGYTPVYASIA